MTIFAIMMNTTIEEAKSATVFDCTVLQFNKIHFDSGNITPLEGNKDIPFQINRVFYLYDIPGGEERGAHAHKECHQLLKIGKNSMLRYLKTGEIEGFKIGGRWRIYKFSVIEFLRKR